MYLAKEMEEIKHFLEKNFNERKGKKISHFKKIYGSVPVIRLFKLIRT